MDSLKDLVYVLNRYAVRDIEVITNPDRKKSLEENRYWEFYTGLQKNKWKDEDQMAAYFKYASKDDKGFKRLKEGLKERLLNSILFIDVGSSRSADFHQKRLDVNRYWAIAQSLYHRGATDIYLQIAQKTLDLAIEVQNYFAVVQILGQLRHYYAARPALFKELEALNDQYFKYWDELRMEQEAGNDYLMLVSHLSASKGLQSEFAEVAETYALRYRPHLPAIESALFHLYARLLDVYAHTLIHDWEGGLRVAESAIAHFDKLPMVNSDYIVLFNNQKASCLTMLGQYAEAEATLDGIVDRIPEGKTSWFKNRELAAINALYAAAYPRAWELTQTALRHERFMQIPETDQETWRLYKGYLHLLARAGALDIDPAQRDSFRLSKWLNDMPLYAQDKRGGNIPLLILQLHFLLADYQGAPAAYDAICNKIEALRKYNSRNLDAFSAHYRTDCFLSLVQLLPKYMQQPEQLQKMAEGVLQKMALGKKFVPDNTFEVEVVPYERQWEWILGYLNKLYRTKGR